MSTLKMDLTTGDLALENKALALIQDDVLAETAQRLHIKLRTFLGEWFLDERIGLPYYEDILVKNPDLLRIRLLFREMILADEQVVSFQNPIELGYDPETRTMSLSFEVLLSTGEVLEFEEAILGENI